LTLVETLPESGKEIAELLVDATKAPKRHGTAAWIYLNGEDVIACWVWDLNGLDIVQCLRHQSPEADDDENDQRPGQAVSKVKAASSIELDNH
jgi:hypothetical protein